MTQHECYLEVRSYGITHVSVYDGQPCLWQPVCAQSPEEWIAFIERAHEEGVRTGDYGEALHESYHAILAPTARRNPDDDWLPGERINDILHPPNQRGAT